MMFLIQQRGRAIALALSACTLIGCSSMPTGKRFSTAASPPEDQALVYFYRPEAFYAKAVAFPVEVNGNEIAKIGELGYFAVTMEPGQYIIRPDTSSIDHELNITVQPGELDFLRLKVDRRPALCFCTSLEFEPVDQKEALEELQPMRRETDRVHTRHITD